jgi:hypothetical protein
MYLSSAGSPELAQAASALEIAARDHLKGLRDWNFDCLLACTFAVGVGLLMELPEIVHDMCEIYGRKSRERKYWLTPSIDRREYPKRDWVKTWSAAGWILIVLGVMGEGWFEERVSKYDSALSNMTDAIVAEAKKESANAEATAKGFDAQIAQAKERAANSENDAASARLETEKLKQAVAWRTIPPETALQLETILSAKPGSVNLRYTDGDPEALFLATQFSRILGKAKWEIAPGSEKFANALVFGIVLPDSTGADAQTLRSAFTAAKIPFSTGPLPQMGGAAFNISTIPGAATLMIGSKVPVGIP